MRYLRLRNMTTAVSYNVANGFANAGGASSYKMFDFVYENRTTEMEDDEKGVIVEYVDN